MEKNIINSNVEENVVDLLLAYSLLQSTIEIFSEAVDYDNSLENKYINMIKVIQKLVDEVEPCIKDLCENLEELFKTEEV